MWTAQAVALLSVVHATTVLDLTLFNDTFTQTSGGRCLDGTSAGYYFTHGTGDDSHKWVIFLDGGGYCDTAAHPVHDQPRPDFGPCYLRANSSLGSSATWPQMQVRWLRKWWGWG